MPPIYQISRYCFNSLLYEVTTIMSYLQLLFIYLFCRFQGAVAVIHFVLTNAAKYDIDETSLVKEVQQLGLPQDSSALIGRSYREFKEKLQAALLVQSYRVSRLVGTEWRIDQPLATSSTDSNPTSLSTPAIHLKLSIDSTDAGASAGLEELALEISAEKLELLIHELTAAQASIQQLSS